MKEIKQKISLKLKITKHFKDFIHIIQGDNIIVLDKDEATLKALRDILNTNDDIENN